METPQKIVNKSNFYVKRNIEINGKMVSTEIFDKNKNYFGYIDGELVIVQTEENDHAYDVISEEKFIIHEIIISSFIRIIVINFIK